MPYRTKKHGKDVWIGEVQIQGRRKKKTFNTRQEAKEWEVQARTIGESLKTGTVSLAEWVETYLDDCESRQTKESFSQKRASFKRFFSKDDIAKPITFLTPQLALTRLQSDFRKRTRTGNALNRDRKDLCAGYNWGMKFLGLPGPNPFLLVPRFPETKHPRYSPSLEDFLKVVEVAEDEQDRILLTMLLHLGLRKNEAFKMKWSDLDLPRGTATVYTRKRRDGSLEYDKMGLTDDLKRSLMWWWEHRPVKDTDYVFVCLDRSSCNEERYGQPFKHRRYLLAKLCEKAGVKPFGFHGIRHLTASWLDRQGVELRLIQGVLRHKNATTTSRYLHELRGTGEVLEQVMPKMGNLVPGAKVVSLDEARRNSA